LGGRRENSTPYFTLGLFRGLWHKKENKMMGKTRKQFGTPKVLGKST
jgi:hypothetical protein